MLPKRNEFVCCKYDGVYDYREVTFWMDKGNTPHFGHIYEKDGRGSQPTTHWAPLRSWVVSGVSFHENKIYTKTVNSPSCLGWKGAFLKACRNKGDFMDYTELSDKEFENIKEEINQMSDDFKIARESFFDFNMDLNIVMIEAANGRRVE